MIMYFSDISKINLNSTCLSEKPKPTYQDDLLPSDDDELINGICNQAAPICDTWIDNHLSGKLLEMTNTAAQPEHCGVEPLSDIYVPLVEIETGNYENSFLIFESQEVLKSTFLRF